MESASLTFTAVFCTLLLAGLLLRFVLASRQIRHVARHRNTVPTAFAQSITPEAHRKAADYTVTNNLDGTWTVTDSVEGRDGTDRLSGIERLLFNDVSEALVVGLNNGPVGLASINDATPEAFAVKVRSPGV